MPLRLIFMGTPEFAVPTLVELVGAGHDIAAVYTRPAKPAGRGMAVTPSPVAREAMRFNLPLLTPTALKGAEAEGAFHAHGADAAIVVAYGLLLPNAILQAPPLGCFNLHASLLPRWRGAAPINRAIMAGDAETGVCVIKIAEKLDTGDIAMCERVPIGAEMTAGELHHALARLGADLMLRAVGALERGSLNLSPQPASGVTYAAKIGNEEAHIDWTQPWRRVHDHCRGLSPVPGAWFELTNSGKPGRVKVLRTARGEGSGAPGTVLDGALTVACGEGAVRLIQVQRAGRQPMSAADFLRGTPVAPGTRLT